VQGVVDQGSLAPSLAVCIATMRRPAGLRALLKGLAAQDDVPGFTCKVVVADNDPEGSAEAVVRHYRSLLGLDIEYVVERRAGVAHARNTAVRTAGTVDWIAFIDDDEVPSPTWLSTLVATQVRFDADVVTGPVKTHFEAPRRPWVAEFDRKRRASPATGSHLAVAATGNVLVARRLLGDEPFDAVHFLDVAEDTDCFFGLSRRGAKIVWADGATVLETIPSERQTLGAMTRRAFRDGRAWSRVERRYEPGLVMWLRRGARGVAHLGIGAATTLGGACTATSVRLARGATEAATGAGQLAGLAGRRPPPLPAPRAAS
jgi:hypothetical protein